MSTHRPAKPSPATNTAYGNEVSFAFGREKYLSAEQVENLQLYQSLFCLSLLIARIDGKLASERV